MSIITDEMNEELLEIAEEAAMNVADMDVPLRTYLRAALAAVAPMIAKAEREACAKIINDRREQLRDDTSYWGGPDMTNRHIIEPELMALDQAIRARQEPTP